MSLGMGSRPVDWMKILREQKHLEARRLSLGLTPLEHLRWQDLAQKLRKEFPGQPEPSARGRLTRLCVDFRDPESFEDARIHELPRGGLFIATPFVSEIGTEFELLIEIRSADLHLEIPCTVVSHHVGDGFSTQSFGMGLHFGKLSDERRTQLERVEKAAHFPSHPRSNR